MEQPSPTNFLKKITDQPSSNQSIFETSSPDSDVFLDHDTGLDGSQQDYILPVTKSIQKLKQNKRKYNNTSNELRLELIDAVENHGEKIKSAAKRLGINYSSAKAICQIFKREGRSNKKVLKRKTAKQQPEAQVPDGPVYLSPAPKTLQGQPVLQDQDGESYKIPYASPTAGSVMQIQANPLKEDGFLQESKEPEITHEPLQTIDYSQSFPINSNLAAEVKQPPQQIDQRMNQNNTFLAPQFTRVQPPIQMLNNYPGGGYYYIQPGPMMQQSQIYSIAPNTLIPVIYTNQQAIQPQQQVQTFPVSFQQNPQQMNQIPMEQFQNREMNMNMGNSSGSVFENNEKKNMNSSNSSIQSPNKFSNQNLPSLIPQQPSEFSQPKNNFHYQQQSLMNNQMNGFQFINPTVYILPRAPNGMPIISNTQVIRNTYSQQSNTITTQPGMVYYGGNNMPDFTNNSQDLAKKPPNSQM